MAKIDPFSVRILDMESPIRFAHFSMELANVCRKKLLSKSPKVRRQGENSTIKLFRTLRAQIMDYQNLRGSSKTRGMEQELTEELKKISKEATILLVEIKHGDAAFFGTRTKKKCLQLLNKIINQEEKVLEIAKRLKRKIPSRSHYYFAGIDGGATKTIAVVSDSKGDVLAEHTAETFAPHAVGIIKSFDNLIKALKKATEKALKKQDLDFELDFRCVKFKRVFAGLSGIGKTWHGRANELIKRYVEEFYPNIEQVSLVNDRLPAWYGAFQGEPGIVVTGGTGTTIYGRNGSKEASSIRGGVNWNGLIRLEGREISYHGVLRVNELLQRKKVTILVTKLRKAFDQRKIFKKQLTRQYFNLSFTNFIKLFLSSRGKRSAPITDCEYSSLVKLVMKAANEGDKDARDLIEKASEATCIGIETIAKKIGLHNKPFRVAYVGSVIKRLLALRNIRKALPMHEPYAKLVKARTPPWIAAKDIAVKGIYFY